MQGNFYGRQQEHLGESSQQIDSILVSSRHRSGSDLVLSLQSKKGHDLVGELVGALTTHFQKSLGRPLDIRKVRDRFVILSCEINEADTHYIRQN